MIFFSGTEFINNRSQSDRLPVEMRFPNYVKKLNIRIVVLSRPIYYAKLLANNKRNQSQSRSPTHSPSRKTSIIYE